MNQRADTSSRKRGHVYLVEELKRAIHLGRIAEGEKLPSTRQLAAQFNASLSTVNSALKSLGDEGLIDYQPRRRARVAVTPKKSGRSPRQIGVVAPSYVSSEDDGSVIEAMRAGRDSWSWHVSHAAETIWHQAGFHVTALPYFVYQDDPAEQLLTQIDGLGDSLAGLLCLPIDDVQVVTKSMDARNVPWVTINAPDRRSVYNFVEADNVGGGLRISECFAELGIQRVLVLGTAIGLNHKTSEISKISGLCQGFIERGISVKEIEVVSCGGWHEEFGYKETLAYLKRAQKPPQAIYATGDLLAIGGIRACHEYGLRIPEDVAVVGCTGLDVSSHVNPALTTLNQPMEHIGAQAAGMLLEMIREEIRRTVGKRIPSPITFRKSMVVPSPVRDKIDREYRNEIEKLGLIEAAVI